MLVREDLHKHEGLSNPPNSDEMFFDPISSRRPTPSNTDLPAPGHRSGGSHQPPGETKENQGQVSKHSSTAVDSAQPYGEEGIEGRKAKIK